MAAMAVYVHQFYFSVTFGYDCDIWGYEAGRNIPKPEAGG